MDTYQTLDELKKNWLTPEDLYKALKEEGYSANIDSLKRWEKAGIIPLPKRVNVRSNEWRVYTKEDIEKIITHLKMRTKKTVTMP